jgi:hypothetical protein
MDLRGVTRGSMDWIDVLRIGLGGGGGGGGDRGKETWGS